MNATTRHGAVSCTAPSRDAAHDPSPGCSRIDWQRYAAEGGEIQRTTVDTCDACGATATVHVIGPYGGVLAFCANSDACGRRQCGASDAPIVARAGCDGERAE
jgi:hypothetical protein